MASAPGHSKPFARAGLTLIGLAWTLPFLQPYHRYPITAFYSEWLAFALGLAAMAVLLDRASWEERALPAVALAPIGLAALIVVQAALGRVPYPEQALTAVLYLAWAAMLIVLGYRLGRVFTLEVIATVLAWFLVAGGILSALAGLLQHYPLSTPLDFLVASKAGEHVYGNVGQSNHFAAHLSFAAASAVFLHARQRLHGALAAACLALFLFVLAPAGTRSTWLYLAALGVLALFLWRRPDGGGRRAAWMVLWTFPAFAAAQWLAASAVLSPPDAEVVTSADRLFQAANGLDRRLQLWREAWSVYLDAPVLGAGFGQFAWHHFLHTAAAAGTTITPELFNHAHNLVLHLMAETGTIGLMIVGGAMAIWLADLRRIEWDLAWWWLLGLLAIIGIHSLLEFPLWYSYFLGITAFLLGLGAGRTFAPRFAGMARMLTASAILVGWLNLVAVISPYREFERLVFLPQAAAPRPAGEEALAKAIVGLYREPLLVPYVELAIAFGLVVDEKDLPDKLALAGRAVRFAPVSVVAYRHALLLALAGEREAARVQFERALRVYPGEAAGVTAQLQALAGRWPEKFSPLLELAAAHP